MVITVGGATVGRVWRRIAAAAAVTRTGRGSGDGHAPVAIRGAAHFGRQRRPRLPYWYGALAMAGVLLSAGLSHRVPTDPVGMTRVACHRSLSAADGVPALVRGYQSGAVRAAAVLRPLRWLIDDVRLRAVGSTGRAQQALQALTMGAGDLLWRLEQGERPSLVVLSKAYARARVTCAAVGGPLTTALRARERPRPSLRSEDRERWAAVAATCPRRCRRSPGHQEVQRLAGSAAGTGPGRWWLGLVARGPRAPGQVESRRHP